MKQQLWETGYVLVLFAAYLALWQWKRSNQKRATGHDPDVLGQTKDPLQLFFAQATTTLTAVVVVIILLHALGIRSGPFLQRVAALDAPPWDSAGLAVGIAGLALCAWAQRTMGVSWRVGIDADTKSALVTSGIYRYVRNPTYLGLFTLNAGLWLVWPTPLVAMFALAFYLLIEMQVRCEEAHLLGVHGEEYRRYRARSARYVPWLY